MPVEPHTLGLTLSSIPTNNTSPKMFLHFDTCNNILLNHHASSSHLGGWTYLQTNARGM